jgi:hypothetical protein
VKKRSLRVQTRSENQLRTRFPEEPKKEGGGSAGAYFGHHERPDRSIVNAQIGAS